MSTLYDITCPYCRGITPVVIREESNESAEKISCNHCHKPFAVYSSEARMLQHEDRSVRAVCVDPKEYMDEGYYLEFLENDHAHPQNIKIPLGTSVLGRYNKDSSADLQLFTADINMERQHARMVLKSNGRCYISDNDSNGGVFVNGRRLRRKELHLLSTGDVVTLGSTTAIAHLPEDDEYSDDLSGFDVD